MPKAAPTSASPTTTRSTAGQPPRATNGASQTRPPPSARQRRCWLESACRQTSAAPVQAKATDLTAAMYSVPRRANDVLLEVEFRGDRKPLGCERYRRTEAGESVTPVRLDRRDRLQVSEARFGPGTFGLRWDWGDLDDDEDDEGMY